MCVGFFMFMSLILTSCLLFSAALICLSPSRFILFLSFPFFPQRTTHPIHGDQYAAHKHTSVQVRARTHSYTAHIRSCEESLLLVCRYVCIFTLQKGENAFLWKAWSVIAAQCCLVETLLHCWLLFSQWFITFSIFCLCEMLFSGCLTPWDKDWKHMRFRDEIKVKAQLMF